tara:strand:+ start:3753 stop:5135 length:1383 start_codon:yes stop_codon:yes gene_type:complete
MDNNDTAINYRIDKNILLNQILSLAKKNNISKWDLGAYSSKDLSVQVDNGESKQLKASLKNSITIRVWNEKKLGITSTSDYSESGIKKAFEGASKASLFGSNKETPQFSHLANEPLPILTNNICESSGIKKLLDILRQAESDLINSHQSIISVPYNGLSQSNVEKLYLNSDNSYRQMQLSQSSIYLYAKGEEVGRKPRSAGSIRTAFGLDDLDIKGCIGECSAKTSSHLNYEPIKTNKYIVCFSPEAFLDLIGAFSSMFNARSILDGVSIHDTSCIGNKISVPFLSISDNALHKGNLPSFTFDGEGTPKQNITLLKDGVIQNLIHSESTARKFGSNPTGHASLGVKASVSPEWFVIEKTNSDSCRFNNLSHKNTTEKYVLVDSLNALHAGVKASQGSFSLPFDGWLVDNGIKTSIEAATVAGDIKYVLNNILQVEDIQIVTNSGLSPHVWVNNLSITGEA